MSYCAPTTLFPEGYAELFGLFDAALDSCDALGLALCIHALLSAWHFAFMPQALLGPLYTCHALCLVLNAKYKLISCHSVCLITGMQISVGLFMAKWKMILSSIVLLLAGKLAVIMVAGQMFGLSRMASLRAGTEHV